ncbi:MAG TPA: M15 family metallopeptidase [Kofleriaceae bacterium]|nr:M15 family metallopeptidase [Kofleriaceae bacterium]
MSATEQAATVSSYVTGTCSTSVVLGLSKQISDEIGCMSPTALVRFTPSTKIQVTSSAVLPYLGKSAKTALENVTATVQINSAFRTIAQQYLLVKWHDAGRCGISAAAAVGRSNHESGRALDLANYSSVRSSMTSKGWTWLGSSDPVHFDYLGAADIRGKDTLAFQRLWNRNNPNDRISEDGAYGPQTEARLRQSPSTGFAQGATCIAASEYQADVMQVDGPDRMQPQARAHFRLMIQNNSDTEWAGTTELRLATAAFSKLHDDSWLGNSVITTLGQPVPAHTMGEISFDVTTPAVTEETPIFEELVLADGGTQHGGVQLALTVVPDMEEPTSGDADDQHDDGYDQQVSGGCAAGGGSLGFGAIALLLAARRRRR